VAPEIPGISLVLSSGGARGLAHIGAIQCLEERGYPINCIAGSSMGALVGGIHARGKLDVYAEWVRALNRNDVVRLLDIGWGRNGGLFKGERIIEVLKDLIGDAQIEELPVSFTAVATEINRKREVWIDKGPLFDAIRASMAIPMVFAPVRRGHQLLIDGGVLNPLPIAPTLKEDSGLTIAVDVNGMDQRPAEVYHLRRAAAQQAASGAAKQDGAQADEEWGIRQAITEFFEDWLPSNDGPDEQGMFAIALEAMDAMQVTISRLKASVYTPDILVQVPRNVAHFFEYERAGELIDIGYKSMEQALNEH
jgi:NTE family protein